ncbi:cytochrome c biogenesis factor [Leptolyngbya sp. BL0902]|uniref:tetratricopeptide repeat protein n=1 Tax=Leptolyngbya sp. BL0902 TaxID=1115757 RepID=UPI0019382B84|nr:tetratricopeptide repeat protein [Leptolyngbya sp. BL0902]QQE65807.1 cytochrome c biogenesis factor [Leptolyngbya sp. BL0902]
MLKRIFLLAALALGGFATAPQPVQAQALTPYILPLDYELMNEQGRYLASEAQQLAEYRQFNRALTLAQLAAQLAPNDAQVLALLGGLYLQAGEPEQALALLTQANTLSPEEPRILFALGSAHLQQQDYRQAVTFLERGLRREPNNANALFDLGNAYLLLQQYDQAIARFTASVQAQEDFWPSVNNIGLVLYEQGDANQAVAKWEEALAMAGGEEPEPKLAIAVVRYAQGNCRAVANAGSSLCQSALSMGMTALEQDSRYADEAFLRQNLWGNRLMNTTQQFFSAPPVRSLIAEL